MVVAGLGKNIFQANDGQSSDMRSATQLDEVLPSFGAEQRLHVKKESTSIIDDVSVDKVSFKPLNTAAFEYNMDEERRLREVFENLRLENGNMQEIDQ